jgi:hypothetical protein
MLKVWRCAVGCKKQEGAQFWQRNELFGRFCARMSSAHNISIFTKTYWNGSATTQGVNTEIDALAPVRDRGEMFRFSFLVKPILLQWDEVDCARTEELILKQFKR